MHSFNFSARHNLSVVAAIVAATLITPQTLLADATNTASGSNALKSGSGVFNSAFGYYSLFYNNGGNYNTALGGQALFSNSTGYQNTSIGVNSLFANSNGYENTASGVGALYNNTTGHENTASGVNALYANSTGFYNTAVGVSALYYNNGADNTATGYQALMNSVGDYNTAFGAGALLTNTSGYDNTAVGDDALVNSTTGGYNTALGSGAAGFLVTGSYNVALGAGAGVNVKSGSYNIHISSMGTMTDNRLIRIGNPGDQVQTFIAGISGVTASGGVQVYINSAGQLGTLVSSERFKKDIKSIDDISDKLLQLRPVSFIYKQDETNQMQYGLIAEEVAKVYPELVQYDQEGKPFTVYYHLLTPLLLSELQKEHALTVSQQATLAAQQEKLARQEEELNAQHAEMQVMMQQQKQQLADMAVLQQKLTELNNVLQASAKGLSSQKVALVPAH